jgi:putative methyltransferase (TIGR04325 family)
MMNVKNAIKQLIPPFLTTIYRNYKNGFTGFYIWKGVYKKYQDVPQAGNSYYAENLARETAEYTKSLLNSLRTQRSLPYHINDENTYLPVVAAMILDKKKKVSVLDLGGGMGVGFISLLSCIGEVKPLEYLIIETPAMSKLGEELFRGDTRIRFLTEFPPSLADLDIVYINSALQYFETYRETLKKLSAYGPEYFLFVKFSAGEIPTYATSQKNLRGTTSAYWFFNVEEIIQCMLSLGYALKYKSVLGRVYDQSNFSPEYRLNQACNLLFSKIV